MATRVIDGPEKDFLDMTDLVHMLRLSESAIKRLIDAGEFPQPLKQTPQTSMWTWEDVVFWALKVKLRPRLVKKEKGAEVQRGPTGSQQGPTDEQDEVAD